MTQQGKKMHRRVLFGLLVGWLCSPAIAQQHAADVIYVNGKIFTANAKDDVVEAFAVEADRFLAAGSNADIRKWAGAGTRVVDLKGHFVTPGLADGHFHNEGGGAGIDLSHVRSMAELMV